MLTMTPRTDGILMVGVSFEVNGKILTRSQFPFAARSRREKQSKSSVSTGQGARLGTTTAQMT